MQKLFIRTLLVRTLCVLGLAGALNACSESNDADDDTPPPASETRQVHGVAAVGAPIGGAAIAFACADRSTATTTTASDGRWSQDVAAAALPCALKLSGGTIGGVANTATLYSFAAASDGPVTANLTPLSDLLVAQAVQASGAAADVDAWFGAVPALPAQFTEAVANAVIALRNALAAAGYTLPEPFSPLAADFTPVAGDVYDDLLEALAAALAREAGSVHDYAALRDSFIAGGALPAPQTGPVSTPLPDDKLGVSFSDLTDAHLWLQPDGQGGITAINGEGDGRVIANMGDRTENGPDGTVSFLNLPNKTGTYVCGSAVGSGSLHMQVTFNGITNPRKTYVTFNDAADPDQRTLIDGYSCSVTLTHVGSFTSQYIYDDDVIEGTFTAKLRQASPDCAGEGNCQPYKELLVSNGKFRINKSGRYTPPAPPASGAGLLGNALKNTFAGDYVLKCSASPGQAAQAYAFSIKADGSSVFEGAPLIDAAHPGRIEAEGFPPADMTLKFQPSTPDSAYVVLGFKPDGSFYPNSVRLAGAQAPTLYCYSNSGHSAPAASAQAINAVTDAVKALARSENLLCSQAGAQDARAFSINSDASAQVGSESFAVTKLTKVSDDILFGVSKRGNLTYADLSGGQFRTLGIDVDATLATIGALLGTGLGPNDVSSCTAP